jgi:4-phytase/acid phosphatase
MRTAIALLVSLVASAALPSAAAAAPTAPTVTKLDIVLMRHGVRSPTKPATSYAAYAIGDWPTWTVEPGMLTPHGHAGMTALGGRLRRLLLDDGVVTTACPGSDALVVIGDTTPRNRESAGALLKGVTPGCATSFLSTEGDANNPLFHYLKDTASGKPDDEDDDGNMSGAAAPPALAELQRVLLGCTPATCEGVANREHKKLLLDDANHVAKAMKLAGTLSENLMLAYVEGTPMKAVAFGRADAGVLGRLITLHNAQFATTKKAMPAAANAGSNLVAHILASLDAARGAPPDVAPLSTSPRGAVVLVGHDTNLANVAGVLGLDWHDSQVPDDYPPGGALVFSLVQRGAAYVIRVRSLMPSMEDLRANRFDKVIAKPVRVRGCRAIGECTADEFDALARKGIDPTRVASSLPTMVATQGENRK